MSRPRSEERRSAILAAATNVVASQGIGAATATIAKAAGVSNGSLFLYFDTKSKLLNELYLELKSEMGERAMGSLPLDEDVRDRFHHVWTQWLAWATSFPEKRRALAQLDVCDEVTAQTHHLASASMTPLAELLQEVRSRGPMADEPLGFVLALTTAIAESTIDAIIREPAETDSHSRAGFEAIWRVLAATPTPARG